MRPTAPPPEAAFAPLAKTNPASAVTVPNAYSLEYGVDEMEMRRDAVKPGERGRRRADGD